MNDASTRTLLLSFVLICVPVPLFADDWSQYKNNAGRIPRTKEVLSGELSPLWVRKLSKPVRAWKDQENQTLDYDVNYEPIVMGKRLFIGSMNDDSVRAYDTETGRELWCFYTEGPVRFAPAGLNDKVYVTSDDGYLYCLAADTGKLIWKFQGGPTEQRLIGNQRMISMWPARTGAAIYDGTVYFGAGFWPFMGCFIHAVDAQSGKAVWTNSGQAMQYGYQPHKSAGFASVTPQGYLLVDENGVSVPGGRGRTVRFNRLDGSVEGTPTKAYKPDGLPEGFNFRLESGDKAYGVTRKGLVALKKPGNEVVWEHRLEGSAKSMIVADGKLFVSTLQGGIHCFAPESAGLKAYAKEELVLEGKSDAWQKLAATLIDKTDDGGGYTLLLGIGSSRLAVELLLQSEMKLVVVDPSPEKVAAFRRQMNTHGLYGNRVSAFVADPDELKLPPYFASLICSEALDATLSQSAIQKLHEYLRPYTGILALDDASLKLLPGEVCKEGELSFIRRGKLDGAADWTHHYADAGNTVFSPDKQVKLPLGLLWFGGTTNNEVLPKHGHGPNPQVVEGRLYLEGPDMLRCIDIYTGRKLWQARLPGVGKQANNQKHFSGAGEVGSNYVSQHDYIYVIYQDGCLLLDAKTGEQKKTFKLPGSPFWGTIRIMDKYLVACVRPKLISLWQKMDEPTPIVDNAQYASGSEAVVVMDRFSGEVLWKREAKINFRHNAVALSKDTVFCLDNYSKKKEFLLQRRGQAIPNGELLALDIATGKVIWQTDEDLVGTFLSYSSELDYLVMAGSHSRDRAYDESFVGIVVYKGKSGSVVWKDVEREQTGPLMLSHEKLISNGASGGYAYDLRTGKSLGWKFNRQYGCNTALAAENFLFFRSGAAGYFDLKNLSGTGSLGGFKSGCTSNMIAAGGVLTVPDYTRGCVCGYQSKTSLALVHMPDVVTEHWTFGAFPSKTNSGINFGAPGDRYDQGILWLGSHGGRSTALRAATKAELTGSLAKHVLAGDRKSTIKVVSDEGKLERIQIEGSPYEWPPLPEKVALKIDGGSEYCHHSLYFSESPSQRWVASSGIVGVKSITFGTLTEKANGTVKLYFAEPEADAKAGDRVFDVYINDKKVLTDFDIVKDGGGTRRLVTKTFPAALKNSLQVRFVAKIGESIISGIELDTGMLVAVFNGNN